MDETRGLAEQFEEHRSRLRAVAHRMLGSQSEADDAVQEAWIRASRAGVDEVENLGAWLTTIVSRVCLNMLRSRASRREHPFDPHVPDPVVRFDPSGSHPLGDDAAGPEQEAATADSVSLALLVVLDMLPPAERM